MSQNQSMLEMIQTPVIVTFANQKGRCRKDYPLRHFCQLSGDKGCKGCGHRLRLPALHNEVPKGRHQKYGEQDMPYEVWAYEANDKAMMTSLMEKLHNDPEIDVVLMDSPAV